MARLLKLPEVAQRLEVSEKTARRYVKAGILPSAFVGNAYRVNEEDVEEYLRRAKVEVGGNTPKAQVSLSPEDEQRRSVPEALYSYMGLRAKSLEAELKDENSPDFKNATAATNWVARVQQEAKDWADWAVENWSVLMPPGGSFFDKNTWLDAWNIMGHLMTFHVIIRRAEQRIAAMNDQPDELAQRRLERARQEAQESEQRLQELRAASG